MALLAVRPFFTVTLQVYFFLPLVAVMVAVPVAFAVTLPFLLTVATLFFELFQVVVPLAFFSFNCSVWPRYRVALVLLSFTLEAA